MSVSRLHSLYGVALDTASGVNAFLAGMKSFALQTGIEEAVLASDGDVYAKFVAVLQAAPRMTFESFDLATALGAVGLEGLAIDADGDDAGVVAHFRKFAEGGTRASGSAHLRMTVAKGLILPRQIQADTGSPASISYELIAIHDGTNDPVVVATGQALSGTPGVAAAFVAGPVKINGTLLEGVQSIRVDFGIREVVQYGDGDVFPTFAAIQGSRPTITIRTTDVIALSTFGMVGAAQGATDSLVWFRKLAADGTRVANGTAEHIRLSIDQGRISVRQIDASDDAPAMTEVQITPTYDGTNAVFAINTAAAIS